MSDVAERAQVSQSTVSRVLNQTTSSVPIGEETRQRVLAAARELGYRPNPLARGLRGSAVLLLGVIVRDIADPFFAQVISDLGAVARANGYNLVLGHAGSSPSEALLLKDILDARHCDGIIALGDLPDDETIFEEIKLVSCPVVNLCRGQAVAGLPTVNVDNRKGTMLLLEHLHQLGHSRIGMIDGGWVGDIRERREAYQSFMQAHGWSDTAYRVLAERNDPAGGYRAMRALLALPDRPTAVFAADDGLAIGALKAAADLGLQVPEAVSIAGFDDIEQAQFTIPALTTVRQPFEELAHVGLQLLLDLIEGGQDAATGPIVRVEPALIVRESCAPPAGGC